MAHILVLTLVFPPDGVSTGVIVGELSADLKRVGHDVTVVTTAPHYNRDVQAEALQRLTRIWGPLLSRSEFHGVRVFHVAMPRKGRSVVLRLLAWTQFHLLSLIVAVALVRRVDVILAPSPPLTIGVCAWLLACLYRAPFVYNVQELYPDIAITLGAIRSRWVAGLLFALERFVYRRARVITAIGRKMRQRIIDRGVPPGKVRLIPNFVDVEQMAPLPKVNAFSTQHGLDRYFVVSYAGNMGPAQGLERVLEAAWVLRSEAQLRFLFVGGGSAQPALEASARARVLANVLFLPHQPYAVVPLIYAASDLCLVPLVGTACLEAVPSKVYRIMACGRPVLACAHPESDLAELVARTGCGIVMPPDQPEALVAAVRGAMASPSGLAAMGEAGRRAVTAEYSRATISAQYEMLVRQLTSVVSSGGARDA